MERTQSHSDGELGSRAYTAGSFQSMKCLKKKKPIVGREGEEKSRNEEKKEET